MTTRTALALGGGGTRGSYERGAHALLVEQGFVFDAVAGVSIGAINALALSLFSPEDGHSAVKLLADIWHGVKKKDFYRHHRPLGVLQIPMKGSVYDTSPLKEYLHQFCQGRRKRPFLCVAVDLDTGEEMVIHTEDALDGHDLTDAVLGSAAIPMLFPPVPWHGRKLVDGGLRSTVPVRQVWDSPYMKADRVVAITPQPPKLTRLPQQRDGFAIIRHGMRAIDIAMTDIVEEDFQDACLRGPTLVIRPREELPGHSLEFDPHLLMELYCLGRLDAERALRDSGLRVYAHNEDSDLSVRRMYRQQEPLFAACHHSM